MMAKHRIDSLSFASVYPPYLAKAERKGVVCGVRVEDIEEPNDAGNPLSRQMNR